VLQDTKASKEQSSDFILAVLDIKTRIGASLGRHEHVLEHTRERMEILEREYEQSGRATQRLCGVYCDRAMALVEIGASDEEVLKLTRKSCDLRRSLSDFDEQQLFTARRAEGMLYLHSRRLEQAEERFMRALKVREDKFGVDDKSNSRYVASTNSKRTKTEFSAEQDPYYGISAMCITNTACWKKASITSSAL
jgi:hypothetical protein